MEFELKMGGSPTDNTDHWVITPSKDGEGEGDLDEDEIVEEFDDMIDQFSQEAAGSDDNPQEAAAGSDDNPQEAAAGSDDNPTDDDAVGKLVIFDVKTLDDKSSFCNSSSQQKDQDDNAATDFQQSSPAPPTVSSIQQNDQVVSVISSPAATSVTTIQPNHQNVNAANVQQSIPAPIMAIIQKNGPDASVKNVQLSSPASTIATQVQDTAQDVNAAPFQPIQSIPAPIMTSIQQNGPIISTIQQIEPNAGVENVQQDILAPNIQQNVQNIQNVQSVQNVQNIQTPGIQQIVQNVENIQQNVQNVENIQAHSIQEIVQKVQNIQSSAENVKNIKLPSVKLNVLKFPGNNHAPVVTETIGKKVYVDTVARLRAELKTKNELIRKIATDNLNNIRASRAHISKIENNLGQKLSNIESQLSETRNKMLVSNENESRMRKKLARINTVLNDFLTQPWIEPQVSNEFRLKIHHAVRLSNPIFKDKDGAKTSRISNYGEYGMIRQTSGELALMCLPITVGESKRLDAIDTDEFNVRSDFATNILELLCDPSVENDFEKAPSADKRKNILMLLSNLLKKYDIVAPPSKSLNSPCTSANNSPAKSVKNQNQSTNNNETKTDKQEPKEESVNRTVPTDSDHELKDKKLLIMSVSPNIVNKEAQQQQQQQEQANQKTPLKVKKVILPTPGKEFIKSPDGKCFVLTRADGKKVLMKKLALKPKVKLESSPHIEDLCNQYLKDIKQPLLKTELLDMKKESVLDEADDDDDEKKYVADVNEFINDLNEGMIKGEDPEPEPERDELDLDPTDQDWSPSPVKKRKKAAPISSDKVKPPKKAMKIGLKPSELEAQLEEDAVTQDTVYNKVDIEFDLDTSEMVPVDIKWAYVCKLCSGSKMQSFGNWLKHCMLLHERKEAFDCPSEACWKKDLNPVDLKNHVEKCCFSLRFENDEDELKDFNDSIDVIYKEAMVQRAQGKLKPKKKKKRPIWLTDLNEQIKTEPLEEIVDLNKPDKEKRKSDSTDQSDPEIQFNVKIKTEPVDVDEEKVSPPKKRRPGNIKYDKDFGFEYKFPKKKSSSPDEEKPGGLSRRQLRDPQVTYLEMLKEIILKCILIMRPKIRSAVNLDIIKDNIQKSKYCNREDFIADVTERFAEARKVDWWVDDKKSIDSTYLDSCEDHFRATLDAADDTLSQLEKLVDPTRCDNPDLALKLILSNICKSKVRENKHFLTFLQPVNTRIYTDYTTVVKKPMCFEEIFRKVDAQEYHSRNEFLADVRLIHRNSLTYNGKLSMYTKDAWDVVKHVENCIKEKNALFKLCKV